MRLKTIFNRPKESSLPLFDEAFLRRLERLSFRTIPALRGSPLGERRSRNLRPALDFSDHRPYSHGDDLRHVDWNAYGRHEELFVKLGEASQSVNIHILLDCSRSMGWTPSGKAARQPAGYSKWDAARRLAGALGYLGLSGGERVEITPFGHTLAEGFGPTEGKRRVVPILKFLSKTIPLPPAKGETGGGLVASLNSYARTHPGGGLLILISDLLDTITPAAVSSPHEGQAGEGLAESLRYLVPPRWQVLVVHLLTEEEVQPTLSGDYDLRDSETEESLPFHLSDAVLTQYRLRVRTWCAELQSACGQRGATYARVLAEWPLEQAVVPYLRQRGVVL
ncbi:MAG: DUF58 domain-containing protein [Anaerolineales bacterium]|nr:DUF58 domain-containing protein [Anaerolineales bacterium]